MAPFDLNDKWFPQEEENPSVHIGPSDEGQKFQNTIEGIQRMEVLFLKGKLTSEDLAYCYMKNAETLGLSVQDLTERVHAQMKRENVEKNTKPEGSSIEKE